MKNHDSLLNYKNEKILELNNEKRILKQIIKEKEFEMKSNSKLIQLKNNKLSYMMTRLKKLHSAFFNYAYKFSLVENQLKNNYHIDHGDKYMFFKIKDWRSYVKEENEEMIDDYKFNQWKEEQLHNNKIEDIEKDFSEFIKLKFEISKIFKK